MALLSCENLSVGYEDHPVLQNINFKVEQGDYLCIVGENGSGKSTLMKTLLGLLPPMEGKLTFGDGLKRNEIGYLPQQTAAQKDFPASVREVVLSGCLNRCGLRPFYTKGEKQLAEKNILLMDLDGFQNRCYRELSGGQQQRVLLARALCATRKLLMLDEPVTGLDPKATAEMYSLIEKLNREQGIPVLMITHDMQAALRSAKQILHLGKEKIFFGTKEEFLMTDVGKNLMNILGGSEE